MRKRPGKHERMNAKRNAFQVERASIIAANLSSPRAARPSYDAPVGFRSSVLSRDKLKASSHSIGFVGPRGYGTPKDTVGRNEAKGGMGYSVSTRDHARAKELAAMVKVPD